MRKPLLLSVLLPGLLLPSLLWLAACGNDDAGDASGAGASGAIVVGAPQAGDGASAPVETVDRGDGLVLEILEAGSGPAAKSGSAVAFHHKILLAEGETPVDDSASRGVPLSVRLGEHKLFPGLERALIGLRAGARARARVPAALAYGEAGFGDVPPNADLIVELTLAEVN